MIVQIINFENAKLSEIPALWVNNLINKCGDSYTRDAFQTYSLVEFGLTALGLGAFIGILLQQMFYPGLVSSAGLKNDTAGKAIGRFAMAFAVSAPWISLYLGLKYGLQSGDPYVSLFF